METIYSYRIIVKVDKSNPEFNLDLYKIGGVPLYEVIHKRLEDYMSSNPAKATTVDPVNNVYTDVDKLEDVIYLLRENLFPPDQDESIDLTTLDEIDLIVVTAIQEAIPTKEGLPQPPIYTTFISFNDSNSYGGVGKKKIYTLKRRVETPSETYVPDTTPFRRRGLVKIQGEEQYREVGQIIGKDLVGNPTTVSSNNQTHVSASETDEQIENSIAVSIWYFKNKTTGNINTFENRSKIPKEKYTSEYERLKIILGLV